MTKYITKRARAVIPITLSLDKNIPIRVLHVDDETSLLKIAKQCLRMEGNFHVETASSIEEAQKKMMKTSYDVIVSDYMMPHKDGLEFLKELRDRGNDVPFIVLYHLIYLLPLWSK